MELEKDLRNKKILDLQNEGKSIGEISNIMGMSKGGIHKILSKFLIKEEIPSKEVIEVKITGEEKKFESFVGWKRVNVNEYANEKTGEIVRVAYVKAKSPDEFGYFVRLSDELKVEVKESDETISKVELAKAIVSKTQFEFEEVEKIDPLEVHNISPYTNLLADNYDDSVYYVIHEGKTLKFTEKTKAIGYCKTHKIK